MVSLIIVLTMMGCRNDQGTGSTNATILGITPNQVSIGQKDIEGVITGTNFSGVTTISMGEGVAVQSIKSVTATEISISFFVSTGATPGQRSIAINTAAGVYATGKDLLTVLDNSAPSASFTITPPTGSRNTVFEFNASGSHDLDGHITSYEWEFGDGHKASGKIVKHRFDTARIFTVTLKVTDNKNTTQTTARNLKVDKNSAPVARFSVSPTAGNTGTLFHFNASKSYDVDGRITDYVWNFGDVTKAKGVEIDHRFSQEGTFAVQLTVIDNTGSNGLAFQNLRVDRSTEVVCTHPVSETQEVWYGEILPGTVDTKAATYVMKFYDNVTCDQVFYRCGDVRLDPFPPKWGDICKMVDLGNHMFRLYIERHHVRSWPNGGEKNVFLHWQPCINYCKGF